MNKLAKTQRNGIAVIVLLTAALVVLVMYYGVIPEQAKLIRLRANSDAAWNKMMGLMSLSEQAPEIAARLEARRGELARREAKFAPSWDAYSWVLGLINSFSGSHEGIKISAYSQPDASVVPFPKFPYRCAAFHFRGTAYYHEFGVFLADLENTFPYCRVHNVVMIPNPAADAQPETLSVNFDLVMPVVASQTE